MFNNQIYGLTKGQYSPTSEVAKVTKSTPFGSLDTPFNPVSLALGAEASFVARTHDMDRAHMQETFTRAHQHNGAAFVEVLQNCNVFNDEAFEKITGKDVRSNMLIPLVHGQPIAFGTEGQERGVVQRSDGGLESAPWPRSGSKPSWCTTRLVTTPGWRSPFPVSPVAPTSPRRSGSSGPSSDPNTARRCPSRSCRCRRSAGWATSGRSCAPARAGP